MIKIATQSRLLRLAGAAFMAFPCAASAELHQSPSSHFTVRTLEYGQSAVQGDSSEKPLLMDLYVPGRCRRPCPVLVAMHGGSFVTGARDIDEQKDYGELLASRGIAVASISYRLEGDRPIVAELFQGFARRVEIATYEPIKTMLDRRGAGLAQAAAAAVEDETKAIAWLRRNGRRFHLNPNRIGLLGASAGAISVLDLAYLGDQVGSAPPPVGVVISIRGMILDDRSAGAQAPLRRGDPPLFIVHGTADDRVPYAEAKRLYRLAKTVGVPVEFHPVAGAGHELGGRDALKLKLDDRRLLEDHLVEFIGKAFDNRLRDGYRACVGARVPCPRDER